MSSLGAIDSLKVVRPSPPKPTIFLIPGAFHTPAHFGPLSRYLEKQGYKPVPVTLPSMSDKAGTEEGGMVQDVAAIRALLKQLVWDKEGGDGEWRAKSSSNSPLQSHSPVKQDPGKRPLVLVMHDTGAVSGIQAAVSLTRTQRLREGKKGGIISMVFINGILVGEGKSVESTRKDLGEPALPQYAKVDGPILRPGDNAGATLFGDLSAEKAAHWSMKLQPQSLSVFSEVVQSTHWEVEVPVSLVLCKENLWVKLTDEMVAAFNRPDWTIETIESGGSPLINHVEELGRMIMRAGQVE